MKVFGESYLAAFTPANNKKPFSKTGVHPFGHSVIKSKDLAPSLKHSKHATLPLDVLQHIEDVIQLFWDTYSDIQCEKDAMDGWVTNSEAKNNSSGEDDDGDHLVTAHNFLYHNQSSSV